MWKRNPLGRRTEGACVALKQRASLTPFLKVAHVQRHRFPSRLREEEEEALLTVSSGNKSVVENMYMIRI